MGVDGTDCRPLRAMVATGVLAVGRTPGETSKLMLPDVPRARSRRPLLVGTRTPRSALISAARSW